MEEILGKLLLKTHSLSTAESMQNTSLGKCSSKEGHWWNKNDHKLRRKI